MIWQEGMSMGGGESIPDGVEIRVVVDFPKETVKWYEDGREIGSAMIAKKLLPKRIVPYIQLNYRRPQKW